MTETEAKDKWCPILGAGTGLRHCLGSDCMMWRWDNPTPEVREQARACGFEPIIKTLGHCGLAGKP